MPTTTNAGTIYAKIVRALNALRAKRQVDVDDLAQDIWLNAWISGTPVTSQHIRHKLFNRVAATKVYNKHVAEFKPPTPEPLEIDRDLARRLLDEILHEAQLSPDEVRVLYAIYYANETYAVIAAKLHWSENRVAATATILHEKLKLAGRRALGKRGGK